MFNKKSFLTLSSVLALSLSVTAVQAQDMKDGSSNDPSVKAYSKVTGKKTIVKPKDMELLAYDLNGNGVLEPEEVGEKLFYQYDRDGNETLDNIEFNRELMVSFAPVEETRVFFVDYDNDGVLESEEVENDVVMAKTGLDRFDTDGDDGVTAREFIGRSFLQLDIDDSGMIEPEEWKNAYMNKMVPKAANNAIYNN